MRIIAVILCAIILLLPCGCNATRENRSETQTESVMPNPYEQTGYRSCNTTTFGKETSVYIGLYRAVGFFSPDEPIDFFVSVTGTELDGKTMAVQCYDDAKSFDETQKIELVQRDGEEKRYSVRFTPSKNGAYHIKLTLAGDAAAVTVGVHAPVQTASDDFYYGSQAYLWRVYTWGTSYNVTGRSADEFAEELLDSIRYMGVNLLREDASWSSVQTGSGEPLDTTLADKLIAAVKAHNLHYNMLLNATPDWAVDPDAVAHAEEQGLASWQTKPLDEAWKDYVTKMAEKYAADESLIWEIWNEPDWEFFSGTEEEYISMLRTAGEALKKVNPNAFVYAGGLAFNAGDAPTYPYAHDRSKLFAGYKTLIDEKIIDTFGYHIHTGFGNDFLTSMQSLKKLAEAAGVSFSGSMNSECGVYASSLSERADGLIRKCLWTRAHGSKMFVAYVHIALTENDRYVMFSQYLNPNLCAVEYAELINRLGQSEWVENISDGDNVFADMYSDGTHYTVAAYTASGNATLVLPEGKTCTVYDAVGNATEASGSVTLSDSATYLVFDEPVGAGELSITE